jgi:fluoride exporter
MNTFLVAIGAALGAPSRYWVDQILSKRHNSLLPLQTLLINILGSFLLGLVIRTDQRTELLFGVGFAGAFTTWSTFALEAHYLIKAKKGQHAISYLLLTLALGLAAGALGLWISGK